jgi:hypothetical protein
MFLTFENEVLEIFIRHSLPRVFMLQKKSFEMDTNAAKYDRAKYLNGVGPCFLYLQDEHPRLQKAEMCLINNSSTILIALISDL